VIGVGIKPGVILIFVEKISGLVDLKFVGLPLGIDQLIDQILTLQQLCWSVW
jgi:hypothetical protein